MGEGASAVHLAALQVMLWASPVEKGEEELVVVELLLLLLLALDGGFWVGWTGHPASWMEMAVV